jgi:signal transduction histidine kinase
MGRRIGPHRAAQARLLQPAVATVAGAVAGHWHGPIDGTVERLTTLVPSRWRLGAQALLGVVAAAGVGYLTAVNPHAVPAQAAVEWRVSLIGVLLAAGLFAQTNMAQAPMGRLLVGAGFFSALWLLNGSSDRFAFTVGLLVSGLIPGIFCWLMLAHPTGRLRSDGERRFLVAAGGGLALLWSVLALTRAEPFDSPLLRCAPRCPSGAFHLGVAPAEPWLTVLTAAIWLVLAAGTTILLIRRARTAHAPLRRAVIPVLSAAIAYALVLAAYLVSEATGAGTAERVGDVAAELSILVPIAVLLGLALERLFIGQALADFVTQLTRQPSADPQRLMGAALRDPSLRIAYRRPEHGTFVDFAGAPLDIAEVDSGHAITWIERSQLPVAAVIYDAELSDQERFVQAAGAAALMRLEQARLEADLRASTADLAASRTRLVETAYAERHRIERDLHDSIQQDLVGLRIKLDMAAEAVKEEPVRGRRMILSVGRQMDDVLEALRSLAHGIYPSLLDERGLGEALKSAARRCPLPVSVDARGVGRFSEDVEVAVYFCCLEALQNFVKHSGPGAVATIRLRAEPDRIRFQVTDTGIGFDMEELRDGKGLVNMRDRIEAVGGTLSVTSRKGLGTSVRGSVPVGSGS